MTNNELLVTLTRMSLNESLLLKEREAARLAVVIINRSVEIRKELVLLLDECKAEANRL